MIIVLDILLYFFATIGVLTFILVIVGTTSGVRPDEF